MNFHHIVADAGQGRERNAQDRPTATLHQRSSSLRIGNRDAVQQSTEDAAGLFAAGFDDGRHSLHEAAAAGLCVPKDSFRQMTACRKARSVASLVGSTPSTFRNIHSHSRC
jgi:hypothetical protein